MTEYQEDHHIWNPIAILFFAAVAIGLFIWFSGDRWFVSKMLSLDWFELAVLSLATFRLIRFLSFDKITQFARNWFLDDGRKPRKGIRRVGAELMECIWCTGLWSALVVMGLYFFGLFGQFLVYLLAIAALGTFFMSIAQFLARSGK